MVVHPVLTVVEQVMMPTIAELDKAEVVEEAEDSSTKPQGYVTTVASLDT